MSEYTVLGKCINVTPSLQTYVAVQSEFQKISETTTVQFNEDAQFFRDPNYMLEFLKIHIENDVMLLCSRLEKKYGFSFTKYDILKGKGYPSFQYITEGYENFSRRINQIGESAMKAELQSLEMEARAKVTGLSFGIISNSLVSHLIYQIQNEAAIRKQIEEAEKFYEIRSSQVEKNFESTIDLKCREYYSKVYTVQMREAINDTYLDMMTSYLRILHTVGAINLRDIENYDYSRSLAVLENISSENAINVIGTAIELCPFNVEAYISASRNGLYNAELSELAEKLGLSEKILGVISPKQPNDELIISEEIERLVLNRYDRSLDKEWKMQARSYLADSRKLMRRFPLHYAGYGLSAAYLIATNYDANDISFWDNVNELVDSFILRSVWIKDDIDDLLNVIKNIFTSIEEYIDAKNEHLDEYLENNSAAEGQRDWIESILNAKRATIPAIKLHSYLIEKMNCDTEYAQSIKKMQQNTLLWELYLFGQPIRKESGNYHLPLDQRKFAIRMYDSLIAKGVAKFEYGSYALKKKHVSWYDNPFQYGSDMWREESKSVQSGGCYIATAIYGSYECSEVWVLRRFRDECLAGTWYGKLFIRIYYAVSPILVKRFGNAKWFERFWKPKLDVIVIKLKGKGISDRPYEDLN